MASVGFSKTGFGKSASLETILPPGGTAGALLVSNSGSTWSSAVLGSVAGSFPKWDGAAWADSVGGKNYLNTDVVGAALVNTTPTDGVGSNTVQYSGILRLGGRAWKANATAADQQHDYGLQVRTTTGGAASTAALHMLYSAAGGVYTSVYNLSQTGIISCSGRVSAAGGTLQLYNAYADYGITVDALINTNTRALALWRTSMADTAGTVATYAGTGSSTGVYANRATIRLLSVGVGRASATAAWLERVAAFMDGSILQSGTLLNASSAPIPNAAIYWQRPNVEVVTLTQTAYTDTAMEIPAGATLYGISGFSRTKPATAATVDVGIDGATTRFATGVSLTAGGNFSVTLVPIVYAIATKIRLTFNASPTDDAGRIVIAIHYHLMTAPAA